MTNISAPADGGIAAFCDAGPDGKPRFVPAKLGRHLTLDAPAAKDGFGRLYAYHDHAWLPDGEQFYPTRMRELLDHDWRARYASETMTWIDATGLRLDDRPPVDRIRVANGILHIRQRHVDYEPWNDLDASPYSPVRLPVVYDGAATSPRFERFMEQVLPNRGLRDLAQEWMGYMLVADNSQQKALLAHGPGGNGKTTWINVMFRMLGGKDNCAAYPLHMLVENRFGVGDLYGKLGNVCADLSARELSSSALFRMITGGDPIRGEHKYCDPFTFEPFTRLVFAMNRYPAIADPTTALFDRWLVLPFTERFRGTRAEDKQLLDKLTSPDELTGVLNWALRGLLRLSRRGQFLVPAASVAALGEFKLMADQVRQFVRDEMSEPAFYRQADLWRLYREWRLEAGHQGLAKGAFFERLRAVLGAPTVRNGYPGWFIKKGRV